MMLDFERQMFLDMFEEDGLLIMARGLGINRLFLEFLKVYCDPASLVLVLNATPADEAYFSDCLEKQGIANLPKSITNEIVASERTKTYMQGGVLFVTSRILVVDLLKDVVPIEHVTGILVYRAQKIIESCQEAFALRLFRQKNKTGFIKAFTDNPEAFTSGYSHVERVMKSLFVKKLFLWPRFHATVALPFQQHKVDVIEVHQQMTPAMTACQTSLLDLINACINELKRANPSVDTDEITVENALSKSFDLILRLQLDPIWNQLSFRTRQLVSDLKTLKLILRHLTHYDSITFYSLVQSIRSNERSFGQNTGWLFLDAADSLFSHAKERVYGCKKSQQLNKAKKKKKPASTSEEKKDEEEEFSDDEDMTPSLEQCPKWASLAEILAEITEEEETCCEVEDPGDGADKKDKEDMLMSPGSHVLICAEDDRTCNQLREFLCEGGERLMNRLFQKYLFMKNPKDSKAQQEIAAKIKKIDDARKGSEKESSVPDTLTLTQLMKPSKEAESSEETSDKKATTSKDAYYGVVTSPLTVLHPLHGCTDPHGICRVLDELQPKYVILYDADMSLVRQIEVYRASRPGKPLRVYFMMYKGSVEEQRYLTTLRREKEAFEYLIREKASMSIPEEQDGKSEDDPNLARDSAQKSKPNSRQGGADVASVRQKIIVDMREFRSELPSLIHKRGIDIEPVTIEVGDYILTPDICVERKSVSDLIGSLNNGRLYQQALSMCRYYKKPMLLIEFDPNKPFTLQAKSNLSSDVSLQEVTSKLAMLTMHFPKLRPLWCPSPYAAAELFEELKAGKAQPNAEEAMSVTSTVSDAPEWNDKYNHVPQDFVLRMPGITSKNFRGILNHFKNLYELSQAGIEKLTEVLGSSVHAQKLYEFLHKEVKPESTAQSSSSTSIKNKKFSGKGFSGRGRGFKRKKDS